MLDLPVSGGTPGSGRSSVTGYSAVNASHGQTSYSDTNERIQVSKEKTFKKYTNIFVV